MEQGVISNDEKRAARAAYRDRDPKWAICVLRVGARAWVKCVADPAALERRMSFVLRHGRGRGAPAGMAAAFAEAGALSLEVVETLDPDLSAMARETRIKARLAHWAAALGAAPF